jgi:phospholipid/cholesterol/gamma-HCH transport system permease protein
MPLLVTLSIFVGIAGGLIVAMVYLDLSAVSYINEVIEILTFRDVFIGLMKSLVFAWVIVIISSYYGFRASGGAEGVGKVTTLSVVASIFWVIVLDALNSILFYF